MARTTHPTRPLTGSKFKYRNAASTDVRATFEKFRRLQRMRERQQAKDAS